MDNSIDDMFPNTFSKKRKEKHTGLHAQKMHRTAPVKAAVSRGEKTEREGDRFSLYRAHITLAKIITNFNSLLYPSAKNQIFKC